MPIRRLSRGGPQEQIDPQSAVSGAIVGLLTQEQEQRKTSKPRKLILAKDADRTKRKSKGSQEKGQGETLDQAKADGADQGGTKGENEQPKPQCRLPDKMGHSVATKSLGASASEILAALHESKQALAKEMESNLKQLKAILQETQRIAKEMEAVLREAKNEPNPGHAQAGGAQEPQWEPPDYKQMVQEQWEPPTGATPRRLSSRDRANASWEPPRKKEEQKGSSRQPH